MERLLRLELRGGRFGNVTPERSRIMSSVRGKRNKTTEGSLRMALVRAGLKGWKLHAVDLPGKPDFYFPTKRVAVFVDGCFWHGCPRCGHVPKTNTSFWRLKIKRNQERDARARRYLRSIGIQVVRFWEHELRNGLPFCVEDLFKQLRLAMPTSSSGARNIL